MSSWQNVCRPNTELNKMCTNLASLFFSIRTPPAFHFMSTYHPPDFHPRFTWFLPLPSLPWPSSPSLCPARCCNPQPAINPLEMHQEDGWNGLEKKKSESEKFLHLRPLHLRSLLRQKAANLSAHQSLICAGVLKEFAGKLFKRTIPDASFSVPGSDFLRHRCFQIH